ncbi:MULTISPECIES: MocR-like transcriptional regulator GabR [Staphylococcus]|uniref:MocR-like transcriptional regulator GabR n=1 Tax=Staphylococcus TaxID=1279 RepID=UPI000925E751|nr:MULTISPECIES: PLP-dependent aminotransferase family protein [Staphylococcus]RNM26366.1 PLP-dependent aminotransferase family protein [Staphylococcus cohnii]MBL0376094.1 PLP-dependent aminotransferase family protein [Staphylococcus sp. S75]MBL0383098.1 PLP-dependent aminotransferase family protein [Staphylococcus sp. S59]MBL0401680.1 PLP-dependent aminotransferase family protein [Staphylococcus sp. S36]MDU9371714.1 PLP-dependent aminotransferase family protein [Staphylococcus ureilyticus]
MRRESGQFIYRQLYSQLKEDILAFKYESHEKLPSKRDMSQHLNISVNSVKAAYEQLLAEGYIYTEERKGYFIEPLEKLIIDPNAQISLNVQEQQIEDAYDYSFSHMSTDISAFPVEVWTKLVKRVFENYDHELSSIPQIKGPIELRQSIAKLVSYQRGIQCHPEQIVIGSGTNILLTKLIQLLPDEIKIAVENPGYSRFRTLIRQTTAQLKPIALDHKGISIEAIKQAQPDATIVTPSHQFPMGIIMPVSRRIDLLNWASQTQSYIIEDDYDSEFKYETDNIPSLFSFDKNERVIYLGTFSKTLMPGLRMSYMILPINLVKQFDHYNLNMIPDFSTIHALTLNLMIKEGYYEKYVKKMHQIYGKKRETLITHLSNTFTNNIRIKDTRAGLHFIVEVNTPFSYQEIESRAKEMKLELYTLNRFSVKALEKNSSYKTLIIGFSKIKQEQIPQAVQRLKEVIWE